MSATTERSVRPRTPLRDVAARAAVEPTTRDADALASWRSPEHSWQIQGRVEQVAADRLADRIARLSQEHGIGGQQVAMVALPFDHDGAAAVVTAEQLAQPMAKRTAPAEERAATPVEGPTRLRPTRLDESRTRYARAVRRALALIDNGAFDKAVLARKLDLHCDEPLQPEAAFGALAAAYPSMYTFNMPLPIGGSLLGASPELLISKQGLRIRSHPLAGSTPRSPDPGLDEHRATELLASEKDNREHRYVVDAIADALTPYCRTLHVPETPALFSTRTVWHLGTFIQGELHDDVPSLELARALHPTPAVGGSPRDAALTHIGELEDFDREYYSGAVGWTNVAGDGEWAVAIRCAHVDQHQVRAYAGAGIVAGSQPQAEVEETSHKMRSFLDVIGAVEGPA